MGKAAAILLCAAAALALAVSQAFVIHDVVAAQHGAGDPGPWPVWATWAMALGFELAIAAGVMAAALTGYERRLILADAGLIGMSIAVAAGVESTLILVPAQYALLIVAAHRLHRHYHPETEGAETVKEEQAPKPVQLKRANPKSKPESASPPSDWRERVLAGEVDAVETKTKAAQLLGVHPSTFGRAFEKNGEGWVEA